MKKRIIASFLLLMMVLSILPAIEPIDVLANTTDPDRYDMLDAEDYKQMGFNLKNPKDFDSSNQENPLQNYTEVLMSELYVGFVNKKKANVGSYALFDTMDILSKNNATISDGNKSGNLNSQPVVNYIPYTSITGVSSTKNTRQAHNAISLNMGYGKPERIIELSLYYGDDNKTKKSSSYVLLELKEEEAIPGLITYKTLRQQDFPMSKSGNNSSFKNINAISKKALTSMAVGDYNGDGKEELAVYFPRMDGWFPQIVIIDTETLEKKQEIELKSLNAPGDSSQFNYTAKNWLFPVVHLATTRIAGRDDLVVSVSLPYHKDYSERDQRSVIAVYHDNERVADQSNLANMFMDRLTYASSDTHVNGMRFVSAADADVNGNGTQELVVAGYRNYYDSSAKAKSSNRIGTMYPEIYLNMVVWDNNSYKMVYNNPLLISNKELSEGLDYEFCMLEPVSLTPAKLSMINPGKDYIFAAGAVTEFVSVNNSGGNREADVLAGGYMAIRATMPLRQQSGIVSSKNQAHVSTAVAGHFAKNRPTTEQIVVMNGRSSPNETFYSYVDYDITWIWMEGDNITCNLTNESYLNQRTSNSNGTFLTICGVKARENSVKYEYIGKSYGWSLPAVMAAFPAVPYWKEIPYNGDVGTVGITTGNTKTTGFEVGVEALGGVALGASAMFGAGFLGNKGVMGGGFDITALVGIAFDYFNTKTFGYSFGQSWPGNEDYLLLFTVPVVTYHYEVWGPDILVDQQYIDNYNELKAPGDPPCPYKVGDKVPVQKEPLDVIIQYDYEYSVKPVSEYNEMCQPYIAKGMKTFDMNDGFPHTPGDPTTYPETFQQLEQQYDYPSEDKQHMDSKTMTISETQITQTFGFQKEKDSGSLIGIGIDVSLDVIGKAKGECSLIGAAELEGYFGFAGDISASFQYHTSSTESKEISASLNYLPAGYRDYGFDTQMSVWAPEKNGVMYQGYTAKPLFGAPPKLPENVFAYGETKDSIMLAWDLPNPNDERAADIFELFIILNNHEVRLGKIDAKTKNFFTVSNLEPDTEYKFVFKAYKKSGLDEKESGFSKPFVASTQSAGSLHFQSPLIKDAIADANGNALFEVKAADATNPTNIISYEWEEFIKDSNIVAGKWNTVKSDGKLQPTGATLNITNAADTDCGRMFRAVAYSTPPSSWSDGAKPSQMIYSRAATLYVGVTDPPALSIEIAGKTEQQNPITPFYGEFYAECGEPLTLTAKLTDNNGNAMNGQTVNFIVYESSMIIQEIKILSGTTNDSGVVDAEWIPENAGTYNIAAVYEHSAMTFVAPLELPVPEMPSPADEQLPVPGERQIPADEQQLKPGEQQTPVDEQQLKPDEQQTPADEQQFKPDEQQTSADEQQLAPGEQQTSADEQQLTPGEQQISADEQQFKPDEQQTSADEQQLTPVDQQPQAEDTLLGAKKWMLTAKNMTLISDLRFPIASGSILSALVTNDTIPGAELPSDVSEPSSENSSPDLESTDEQKLNNNSEETSQKPLGKELEEIVPAALAASSTLAGPSFVYSEVLTIYTGAIEDKCCKINYVLNGGSNHPENPAMVYKHAATAYSLKEADKPYSVFDGWYLDSEMSANKVKNIIPAEFSGDITLFAKFIPETYNIIYELNNGINSAENPDTYTMYDNYVMQDAEKDGYEFIGWYTDITDEATRVYKLPLAVPRGSTLLQWSFNPLILYAKWEPKNYSITYNLNGSMNNEGNPSRYTVNDTVNLQSTTKEENSFLGWYEDAFFTGSPVTQIGPGKTGDVSLYAKWEWDYSSVYFDVGFHAPDTLPPNWEDYWPSSKPTNWPYENWPPTIDEIASLLPGGNVSLDFTEFVLKGKTAMIPPDPSRNGFDFIHWCTDGERTLPWVFANAVNDDMRLYASWSLHTDHVLVTYDSQGGTVIGTVLATKDELIEEPDPPKLDRYEFTGWYKDIQCTIPWNFASDTVQDTLMTLYAKWVPVYYIVTFDSMGGSVVQSQEIQEGDFVAQPNNLTRSGYSFEGWYLDKTCTNPWDFNCEVNSDITLYANWRKDPSKPSESRSGSSSPATIGYSFTGGNIYTQGSGQPLTLSINKDFSLFSGVNMDGNTLIRDKLYKAESGSTKVTVYADYIDTLSIGKHTLSVIFNDGVTVNAAFTVAKGEESVAEPTHETTTNSWMNPFEDVREGAWYYGDVEYVYMNNLMSGTAANLFSPNTPLTRGMIVAILYRRAGSPDVSGLNNPFGDVASNQYYSDAVKWAAANGIAAGFDGEFDPDTDITRQDLATILWRYAKITGVDVSVGENANILSYNDAFDISEYAISAMQWACAAGVISGKPEDLLDPAGKATRAEAAAMLHRLMDGIED